jgi:hypothetical protein
MNCLNLYLPCPVLRKRDNKDTHQIPSLAGGYTQKGSE